MKKNSLKVKVWFYLAIFSFIILLSIWIFQIAFLGTYYEQSKSREMSSIATAVQDIYNNNYYYENLLNNLSYKKNICIEIIRDDKIVYSSGTVSNGCLFLDNDKNISNNYKINFMVSGKKKITYNITNKNFKNKTLVYGLKLDDGVYAFVGTSLQPIGATVSVLKNQFIFVTLLVLGLSFLVAYFISKKISEPIVKISKASKELAKGNYNVEFNSYDSIEEIKELSDTLSKTSKELAKTEELRRELMANVSHDLKTPLTLIKANSEMIRDITLKDEKKSKETLDIIISEVDRLNLLVEDVLELSKIQSNVIELNIEKIDLNEIIKSIIKKYQVLEKDGYEIIYNYDSKILIEADKKRMEQVIYNLINNAINYTGKDKKVYIEIENNNDNYIVKIRDTGNGIDKNDINYVWEKYYKVDKSYKRVTHGTGLGLSIVKNIFIMHKFDYGINTGKKGTTFYFKIKK